MAVVGTFYYGYAENGSAWTLNSGNGGRAFTAPVSFGGMEFSNPPTVVCALSGMDAGNQANLRVLLTPLNVTTSGFTLQVSVWADTVLFSVWGMWYAELE
jgi:H-type lectin domain-containing protein